ncbi:unnamed protein product [Schistosoma margrebowiei]|uniref:Uncharacterized protein n=1 Tax=Schistosoma margrebowiei TaxID=48269 RepID=A0A183LAY4_9TREM|nr:unnamed protein product [Schistosoma margrebowiei]
MIIRQIKSNKAAGPDNIPVEALKADVAVTAKILHILFSIFGIKNKRQQTGKKDTKGGLNVHKGKSKIL